MTFVPYLDSIGIAFSIFGLAMVGPSTYLFRMYSSSLDLAQMLYIFAIIYATDLVIFSKYLDYSFLSFMSNFLLYCSEGDYSCKYGYLLSPGVAWAGAIAILFLIVRIVACCSRKINFQSPYNFCKGYLRWFMPPLVYYSMTILIKRSQDQIFDNDFIGAVIVLGCILIITLFELIALKCFQKEQQYIWKKWLQYFSHLRIIAVMSLVAISKQVDPIAKYFIYGPLCLYPIIYLWKYDFSFNVIQRVLFVIQQGVVIALFSLFIFDSSDIQLYDLDFFGLAIVIAIQAILLLPKWVHYCKRDDDVNLEVNPELANAKLKQTTIVQAEQMKGGNSFDQLNLGTKSKIVSPPPSTAKKTPAPANKRR